MMKIIFTVDNYMYELRFRSKDMDTNFVETEVVLNLHGPTAKRYYQRMDIAGALLFPDHILDLEKTVVSSVTKSYIEDCGRARLIIIDKEYLEYSKFKNNL